MISQTQYLTDILKFLQIYFDCPHLKADDDLFDAIHLDSLGSVEIILFLEQKYQVSIPVIKASQANLKTPRAITKMLEDIVNSNPSS